MGQLASRNIAPRAVSSNTNAPAGRNIEYELRIAVNRNKVLESDLQDALRDRSAADEMSSLLAKSFYLTRPNETFVTPDGAFHFRIFAPGLANTFCKSHATSVFYVDWTRGHHSGHRGPAARTLITGCPRDAGLPVTLRLPTTGHGVGENFTVDVGVELVNSDSDELVASKGRGCSRLSHVVNRSLGTFFATVPADTGERTFTTSQRATAWPQGSCTFDGETPGEWTLSRSGLQAYRHLCKDPPRVRLAERAGPVWVHLIGDSVVGGQLGSRIMRQLTHSREMSAFQLGGSVGHKEICRNVSIAMQSPMNVQCASIALGYEEPGYDHMKYFRNAGQVYSAYDNLVRAGWRGGRTPTYVLFSLGSHHKYAWGADDDAERHYRQFLELFLKSWSQTRGFVLILESARDDVLIPNKFKAVETTCYRSTWRTRRRNLVTAKAFMSACSAVGRRCRVLDLFTPTLPMVGHAPGKYYDRGDPVHFLRTNDAEPMKVRTNDHIRRFIAYQVAAVMDSLLASEPRAPWPERTDKIGDHGRERKTKATHKRKKTREPPVVVSHRTS